MVPVSGPALQEIINQLTAYVNEPKVKVRILVHILSISGHGTVHSFSIFSTSAMEAKHSTNAMHNKINLDANAVAQDTVFFYKAISREHGRDAIAIKLQLVEQ